MTFVTLECVRARVWLLPSLRSVGACVWPWAWLPERVVVVHIPCVLTYFSFAVASSTHHTLIDHGAPESCTVRAVLLDCSKSSRQCSLSYLLTYSARWMDAARWWNEQLARWMRLRRWIAQRARCRAGVALAAAALCNVPCFLTWRLRR